jgi:hypothetical protein
LRPTMDQQSVLVVLLESSKMFRARVRVVLVNGVTSTWRNRSGSARRVGRDSMQSKGVRCIVVL